MSSRIVRLVACIAAVTLCLATSGSRRRVAVAPGDHHRAVLGRRLDLDLLARVVAQHLQAKFGQPFIVENKSGASGAIGSAAVAKAEADGYIAAGRHRRLAGDGPAGR